MKPLPTWLRWVMATILVLNGAFAPLAITHAASHTASLAATHAVPTAHCHHRDASKAVDMEKTPHGKCPCCEGNTCQCGCISSVAIPATFPDLRPLMQQAFMLNWSVPEAAVAPPSRLLRPPIV